MFAAISPTLGTQPFNDFFAPDTIQRHPLGFKVTAVDNYWGTGSFVYIKSTDAILKGSLVVVDELGQGTLLPNTANQGFPFGVSMNNMASGTFGWIQVEGTAVYKTNATVAADAAIGIGAAGIAGTNSAGKQLLGVRNRRAATATKTFTATTTTGSSTLVVAGGFDGAFLGMALSGTGIPASTVVAALDPDGRRIYMGSAVGTVGDKTATASGSITLTGTYTGYGAGVLGSWPVAQGAVT
jgi:hypothetical protein